MPFIKITEWKPRTQAIIWSIGWGICFSLSLTIVKTLSTHLSFITLLFVRLCFGLLFFYPFIMKTDIQVMKTKQFPWHCLRAGLVSGAMFCTYYSYGHLPLSLATSIGFTSPLITVLLSALFLKERITRGQWLALIAGYMGVLMVVQPKVILVEPAIGVALLGNVITSYVAFLSKRLSKTESTLQIMGYTLSISFLVIGSFFLKEKQWPNLSDLPWLALAGGLGILSQFCYLQALRQEKPSFIAPFEYLRLVFMLPLGFFIFEEIPKFSTLSGSLIIIATTAFLTHKRFEYANVPKTYP